MKKWNGMTTKKIDYHDCYAWVATHPTCGRVCAANIEGAGPPRELRNDIGKWTLAGYKVERVKVTAENPIIFSCKCFNVIPVYYFGETRLIVPKIVKNNQPVPDPEMGWEVLLVCERPEDYYALMALDSKRVLVIDIKDWRKAPIMKKEDIE